MQPNNFPDLQALENRLLTFDRRDEQIAKPFQWKFTRRDLENLLDRVDGSAEQRIDLRAA